MRSFKELRERDEVQTERKNILNRGAKKEVHIKEDVIEHEVTSVIEVLRNLDEDKSGRIVIVEEGSDNKEVFIDYETANYLLAVYETLTPENQNKFEETLIEHIDALDEIALYCETLVEGQDEDVKTAS